MRRHTRIALVLASTLALACERAQEAADVSAQPSASRFTERVAEPRKPPAGKPPLLVMLHGIGADENDLFPIGGMLDPRLEIVSLRAPRSYSVGYAWFQLDFRPDGTVVPNLVQAKEALRDLAGWLESAPERLGTDPKRTYVLGFSQGAMMTLGLLQTVPERLAGVIALSGRNPAGLFETTADPAAVARVPMLVAHGTYDDLLPVANGRAIRDAFQGSSSDFTYREFPVAHGVSEDEIRLIAEWLAQRLG